MLASLNMYAQESGGGGHGGESPAEQGGGVKRAGSGIYMRAGSGSRNKEGNSLLFITGHYLIKNTYLATF